MRKVSRFIDRLRLLELIKDSPELSASSFALLDKIEEAERPEFRRKFNAHHEAGHAVIALCLGRRVYSVTLVSGVPIINTQKRYRIRAHAHVVHGGWHISKRHRLRKRTRPIVVQRAKNDIIISLTGIWATRHCFGIGVGRAIANAGKVSDWKDACRLAQRVWPIRKRATKVLRELNSQTEMLVRSAEETIRHVAAALLERTTLTEHELHDVIASTPAARSARLES
jgi:hypothetical protein